MEVKWYWLAELLGLVRNVSDQYGDGGIHYEVSARADEIFGAIGLSAIAVLFLLGLIIRFAGVKMAHENGAKGVVICISAVLLVYALLLTVGIGPYIRWYPQDGGFLDLSLLEHIAQGLYFALLAGMLRLGSRLGSVLGRKGIREGTE